MKAEETFDIAFVDHMGNKCVKNPSAWQQAVIQDLRDNRNMIKRNRSAIMFLLFLNSGGLLLAGVIYYLAKIGEL